MSRCRSTAPTVKRGYFRNANGWFHLTSALGAKGVDIAADGWETNSLRINGISSDGTLVFGSGNHNGNAEGFVATFEAGALAGFNLLPAPPLSKALVGVWACGDDNTSAPACVLVFTADGAYYHIEGGAGVPLSGFEWGSYTFDGSRFALTTRVDTDGSTGLSESNGTSFLITVNGDTLMAGDEPVASRIAGIAGTLVGGWVFGDPTQPNSAGVIVFTSSGKFLMAEDGVASASGRDGIEIGQFMWDPTTGLLVPDLSQGIDTNGEWGFSHAGTLRFTLTADALGLVLEENGTIAAQLTRVVDPTTVVPEITSPLSASGVVGAPFTYTITANRGLTFAATGLPAGLSIDPGSGLISGSPLVGGAFNVGISATNTFGQADADTLIVTIAIPTLPGLPGQPVVVTPEVPEGAGEIELTFGEITQAGETTVTILEDHELPAPLPGGFSLGSVVYEVETTATYSGLITLCFSYAGIDFGTATPTLIHYENGEWVDITTSLAPATQTICGATSSLSPFAILASPIVRSGFHAPVKPLAGYLNVAKGGSTVPLKFNIFVNGVQKTTTDGLSLTQQAIGCSLGAPEDDVEPAATTGGTTLRYDTGAGHFVQNWKVPKKSGCYMVRMTTTQDGLALTARFKVK